MSFDQHTNGRGHTPDTKPTRQPGEERESWAGASARRAPERDFRRGRPARQAQDRGRRRHFETQRDSRDSRHDAWREGSSADREERHPAGPAREHDERRQERRERPFRGERAGRPDRFADRSRERSDFPSDRKQRSGRPVRPEHPEGRDADRRGYAEERRDFGRDRGRRFRNDGAHAYSREDAVPFQDDHEERYEERPSRRHRDDRGPDTRRERAQRGFTAGRDGESFRPARHAGRRDARDRDWFPEDDRPVYFNTDGDAAREDRYAHARFPRHSAQERQADRAFADGARENTAFLPRSRVAQRFPGRPADRREHDRRPDWKRESYAGTEDAVLFEEEAVNVTDGAPGSHDSHGAARSEGPGRGKRADRGERRQGRQDHRDRQARREHSRDADSRPGRHSDRHGSLGDTGRMDRSDDTYRPRDSRQGVREEHAGRDRREFRRDSERNYARDRTRTPDFVRPGDWGYEAEDKSRKAMLKQRTGLTDVIILGAGAAGLMCAAHLTGLGLSVCVLDRSRTPGRKLALAGGGHANFSNTDVRAAHYVCGEQGFVEPVLEKIGTAELLRTMDLLGLAHETRDKGKLFLTAPGSELVRALLARCRKGDFTLLLGEHLHEDCLSFAEDRVIVRSGDARLAARHVVLALGSPACPASGASGLGYAIAQRLGHTVLPPTAGLTPLILPEDSPWTALSGVSLPVKLTVCDTTISDDMLFTRTGLSGPAILKASLYWKEGEALEIDLLPRELKPLFGDENGKRTPRSVLQRLIPQRLADMLLPEEYAGRRCAELSRTVREELEARVHALEIRPAARAGLRLAEVCLGGVSCAEIEPLTFTSLKQEKVSIIGEMLDVTGHLGGYNLHWAFASALLCADSLARGMYRLRTGKDPESTEHKRSAQRKFGDER